MNIIDLFCGCGGFSLGAHQAGFKSVLSVDIDVVLSSSYRINFPDSNVVNLDLSKVSGFDLLNAAKSRDIVGIIGGPPCQGFSSIGRRDENDPRNELIGHFFRQIVDIKPSFFVMENVPGLLTGAMRDKFNKQLDFVSQHYEIVGPVLLSAEKLGAATNRKRVVVIGYNPTCFQSFNSKDLEALGQEIPVTVYDAISDLPGPSNDFDEGDYGWAKYSEKNRVNEYALRARSLPSGKLGNDLAIKRIKEGYTSGLMDTIHSSAVSQRYKNTEPGKQDHISKSYKLKWDSQCPTLRAGTGSERGSYQAVRPLHPEEGRVITVREAARLQGFPDWFLFHPTKWHSFRMIGNSVSPYLSFQIMSFLKSRMLEIST